MSNHSKTGMGGKHRTAVALSACKSIESGTRRKRSVENRKFQVSGFARCIETFLESVGVPCKSAHVVYDFLYREFINVEEDQLAKVFKHSLATYFSRSMKQELPDGQLSVVALFPKRIEGLLLRKFKNKYRKVQILWNLLQCKDLANEVPESMIQASYEKHRKVLATVASTPQPILDRARMYAQEFCSGMKYVNKTYLAPNKGYLNHPRSKGGLKQALSGQIRFQGGYRRIQTSTRIDPVVIHIHGKPGKGKSFVCKALTKRLSKLFGYSYDNSYQRSVETEHWDGYRNQLIAQVDDVFSKLDDEDDCAQLIQICSNVDAVLPMADLREKGRKFTSEFLVLSSNHPHVAGSASMRCLPALRRRIYPAYELISYDHKSQLYDVQRTNFVADNSNGDFKSEKRQELTLSKFLDLLIDNAMTIYRERISTLGKIDGKSYVDLFQPIERSQIGEYGFGYTYPSCPESGLAQVQAHAICEPLKVRMITKGQTENWCLKPLQKAMFERMKDFECFRLTSGQHIDLSNLSLGQGFLVSGDYEAATDNLHSDVMRVIVEEMVKVVPSEIIPYLIKESSSHLVSYPKKTKLEPIVQTNGQLMGSLLSFPILCLANAVTIGLASKKLSLAEIRAQINGDDILFCGNLPLIKRWKKIATQLGLKPSVGKNYVSDYWGSINSQLVVRGNIGLKTKVTRHTQWRVESSGLYNCLRRKADGPLTVTEALKVWPKPLVVRCAQQQLKSTPQSVDVSTKYGGLGLITTVSKPSRTDMEIYLWKVLNKKLKVNLTIDDQTLVTGPKDIISKYVQLDLVRDAIASGSYPPKTVSFGRSLNLYDDNQVVPDDHIVFDWDGFKKFRRFYKTIPHLRDFVKASNFGEPVSHSRSVTTWVNTELVKDLPVHRMF